MIVEVLDTAVDGVLANPGELGPEVMQAALAAYFAVLVPMWKRKGWGVSEMEALRDRLRARAGG